MLSCPLRLAVGRRYPRVMNLLRLMKHLHRRVYTPRLFAGLLALLGSIGAGITPASAQVDITTDPAMTKGSRAAPVTIVEFSDYQ